MSRFDNVLVDVFCHILKLVFGGEQSILSVKTLSNRSFPKAVKVCVVTVTKML